MPTFSKVCGGSITVTNFAAANVDDVLITPGGLVIDADGTFPLAPGNYVAVGRVAGEVVTDEVAFTIEACPVATPTPTPTPEDSVGGGTGTPAITLPPTDTFGSGPMAPANDSWRILLVVLAGILASALILTPSPATRRR